MKATTEAPQLHTLLRDGYRDLKIRAPRRQPRVDVVDLDVPSVYCSSNVSQASLPPTPQPLAPLQQQPSREPRCRRSDGDRDRFIGRTTTSWMTTTTTTTVFLPSATVVLRPSQAAGPSRNPSDARGSQDLFSQSLSINEPAAANEGGGVPHRGASLS